MRCVVCPAALLVLALVVGGCTGSAGTSPAAPLASTAAVAPSSAASTPPVEPSTTASSNISGPSPDATAVGTTQTAWGRILDAVPAGFPVFPGASVAGAPPDGAVSGAWVSKASVAEVASWYRDALQAANFAKVDLGNALEDGTRVVDVQGDLPECKAQVMVKPQGGSTLVTVLFGAGCAGGSG